ncbi:hypothetical protein FQR65_LT02036 [Abscondita terminalis]|nr:hypothetical protein FQR65_LT02036 [Abscondita terminalis]
MQNLTEIDRNALENLRTYLRIPSVHPDVNYEPCVQLLKTLAEDIGLEFTVLRTKSDKPNVIITWLGSDTSLTSVMLNSHMDVVPASEGEWSYKPFNADIDENGNIYARGAQDVKSQGVQYLEAIRRLKLKKVQPKRNVHVTFVCDEEIGGEFGMKSLIKSDEFRKLRVGFAIDEAGVAEGETITVHQAERRVWVFKVNCIGSSGHGSVFVVNNAAEKVQSFLDNLYKFRTLQKVKNYEATTINLTKITGGYHSNVVPAKFSMVIDARIPNENFDEFEQLINRWCKEAGDGVTVKITLKIRIPVLRNLTIRICFGLRFKKPQKNSSV